MGSYGFENIVMTTDNVETAYHNACSDALHQSGHDGYNGTISTTSGVYAVPTKPLTLAEATVVIGERLDNLHKWDVCEALPIVEEVAARYEDVEKIEVFLSLTAAVYNDHEALTAAIAKKAGVKADEIRMFAVKKGLTFQPLRTEIIKVDAKATEGKTETRYFILSTQGSDMPSWNSGYPTQAAARADIPTNQVWSFNTDVKDREYEIIAMTRRASGEPLVKATVTVRKVEATFTVQTRRKISNSVVGTVRAGWLFYGWAAS